jgi:hypothetical protein
VRHKNPQTKPGRRTGFDVAHFISHERAVRGIKNSKNELELVRPVDVAAVPR